MRKHQLFKSFLDLEDKCPNRNCAFFDRLSVMQPLTNGVHYTLPIPSLDVPVSRSEALPGKRCVGYKISKILDCLFADDQLASEKSMLFAIVNSESAGIPSGRKWAHIILLFEIGHTSNDYSKTRAPKPSGLWKVSFFFHISQHGCDVQSAHL